DVYHDQPRRPGFRDARAADLHFPERLRVSQNGICERGCDGHAAGTDRADARTAPVVEPAIQIAVGAGRLYAKLRVVQCIQSGAVLWLTDSWRSDLPHASFLDGFRVIHDPC